MLATACACAGCSSPTFADAGVDQPVVVDHPDPKGPLDSGPRQDASTACPTGQARCGPACVDLSSDTQHCGACGRVCPAGVACRAGACPPSNDDRASATPIALTPAELVLSGSTDGATFDGPTGCGSGAPNVWYSLRLAQRAVVYADTAGSTYNTKIYLVDAAGAVVSGACNDDSGCTTGGFTSELQSRLARLLAAGSYAIAVSGSSATDRGAFTLRVQSIPTNYGNFFYDAPIAGSMTVSDRLVGTSARAPLCERGDSGEDVRWFVSCGGAASSLFSVCRSDGGSFVRAIGASLYDPVLYVYSGLTGAQVQCNDDGGDAYNCRGTGGDTQNYGSRISAPMPRGISALVVDERLTRNGMNYTLHYELR
ncbi:MAG: hypothetical protein KA978_00550 [Deltaproteobacteria bacterium]|nr:hypothetical protein [Deltaproteobacteria bacterium]